MIRRMAGSFPGIQGWGFPTTALSFRFSRQERKEKAVSSSGLYGIDGFCQCFFRRDQIRGLFRTGDSCIEKISLQHHALRRKEDEDDGIILASLTFMDRRRIGELQVISFLFFIDDFPVIEADSDALVCHRPDNADITIIDTLVIVIPLLDRKSTRLNSSHV